jgi:hypothetical protein
MIEKLAGDQLQQQEPIRMYREGHAAYVYDRSRGTRKKFRVGRPAVTQDLTEAVDLGPVSEAAKVMLGWTSIGAAIETGLFLRRIIHGESKPKVKKPQP